MNKDDREEYKRKIVSLLTTSSIGFYGVKGFKDVVRGEGFVDIRGRFFINNSWYELRAIADGKKLICYACFAGDYIYIEWV